MEFLKEEKNFDKCIKNICIYCMNPEKHSSLKDNDKRIYGIYGKKKDIVVKFIEHFSSEEIKPFPTTKLVKFSDFSEYKDRHFAISQYYGDLTKETFEKNYEKIKLIIKEEGEKKELLQRDPKLLEEAFLKFNIKNDLKGIEEMIKVYTTNSLYKDLNKWLMNTKLGFFDTVAFFTSRLMYSLNQYGFKEERDKKNKNIIIKKHIFIMKIIKFIEELN